MLSLWDPIWIILFLGNWFLQVKKKKIKYQLEAIAGPTGTDANTIQISKEGIPTGLVSIPCRYMHIPVEIVDEEDLKMTTKLLTEFILAFNG